MSNCVGILRVILLAVGVMFSSFQMSLAHEALHAGNERVSVFQKNFFKTLGNSVKSYSGQGLLFVKNLFNRYMQMQDFTGGSQICTPDFRDGSEIFRSVAIMRMKKRLHRRIYNGVVRLTEGPIKIKHLDTPLGLVFEDDEGIEITGKNAPRLHAMVNELAEKAGIEKPNVYVSSSIPGFNIGVSPGFNVGVSPGFNVGVSPGNITIARKGLEEFPDDELKSILAHEITHLVNHDKLAKLAIFGVMMGTFIRGCYSIFRTIGFTKKLKAFAAYYTLFSIEGLVAAKHARICEAAADRGAIKLTEDPGAFIRAMKRLDELVGSNEQNDVLSTHPPIKDRIAFGYEMLEKKAKQEAESAVPVQESLFCKLARLWLYVWPYSI